MLLTASQVLVGHICAGSLSWFNVLVNDFISGVFLLLRDCSVPLGQAVSKARSSLLAVGILQSCSSSDTSCGLGRKGIAFPFPR